jgi:triphosphatase
MSHGRVNGRTRRHRPQAIRPSFRTIPIRRNANCQFEIFGHDAVSELARLHSRILKMRKTPGNAKRDGIETELKLGVRRSNTARIAAEVMKLPNASHGEVRSLYFDTPEDVLAQGGVSLRLREQSGRWVQTVKLRKAAGNRARFEHAVDVPTGASETPAVDLERHRGTVAGDRAIELLGANSGAAALTVRYESVVQRTVGRLQRNGSQIELAFDRGQVEAVGHALQVSELELELKQGSVVDLIASATDWLQEHDMWLLHESKADRGRRLARGMTLPPITKAGELAASQAGDLDHLCIAVLGNCLEQILPNAAAIAEGSVEAGHVHQLRVGLRRLRTALRELGLGRRVVSTIEPGLTKVFRELGMHRDQQHVHEGIEQRVLQETDATTAAWARSHGKAIDLRALLRSREFQGALLAVIQLKESVTERSEPRRIRSKRWLRPRLERLSRQVARCGKRFEDLASEQQHKVRKRLKRLRYLGEFAASLFPAKRVKRYLRALEPAQDALGVHNDLAVARSMAASEADEDPDALLAVGWIDRAQVKSARKATKRLRKAREAAPFW